MKGGRVVFKYLEVLQWGGNNYFMGFLGSPSCCLCPKTDIPMQLFWKKGDALPLPQRTHLMVCPETFNALWCMEGLRFLTSHYASGSCCEKLLWIIKWDWVACSFIWCVMMRTCGEEDGLLEALHVYTIVYTIGCAHIICSILGYSKLIECMMCFLYQYCSLSLVYQSIFLHHPLLFNPLIFACSVPFF
jgi:hypothetical protein